MRSVATIVIGLVISALAHAADDPGRAALVSRIEIQYAGASVVGADSPVVEMMLSGARPLNPTINDATWNEIRTEVAAALTTALTKKGGALEVLLRGALDPLSTPELKRLSTLFADPVYKKFQGSVTSADSQKRMMQAALGNSQSMMSAVNAVLEKRGLNVPH